MQMVRALLMVWFREPLIPIETEILKQDSTSIKLSKGLRVIRVWEAFPSFTFTGSVKESQQLFLANADPTIYLMKSFSTLLITTEGIGIQDTLNCPIIMNKYHKS